MANYPGDSGSAAQKTIASALTTAVSASSGGWNSSQDVNCTAASLTISLPTPTIADFGKAITLRNIGANPFTVALIGGTLNSAVGLVMNPGSVWTFEAQTLTTANVSATNAAQPVVAEVGTAILSSSISILAGNVSIATAIALTGLTFIAQETATYIVSLNLHGNQTSATQNLTGLLVDTLTPSVAISGSETLVSVPGSIGEYSGSNTFSFSAVAGRTYQARAFNTSGVPTSAIISNANGRSTLTWQKVGGPPQTTVGANPGDNKIGMQAADHAGWILLDGRLKTTLTATQQAAATFLGIGANLPNPPAGATLAKGTVGAIIGSASITQANLPNINLTGGSHSHGVNDSGHSHSSGSLFPSYNYQNFIAAAGGGATGSSFTANSGAGGGAYNGSMGGNTAASGTGVSIAASGALTIPLGGSGAAYTPLALGGNLFLYLGA
jgi:hypothetical protein